MSRAQPECVGVHGAEPGCPRGTVICRRRKYRQRGVVQRLQGKETTQRERESGWGEEGDRRGRAGGRECRCEGGMGRQPGRDAGGREGRG